MASKASFQQKIKAAQSHIVQSTSTPIFNQTKHPSVLPSARSHIVQKHPSSKCNKMCSPNLPLYINSNQSIVKLSQKSDKQSFLCLAQSYKSMHRYRSAIKCLQKYIKNYVKSEQISIEIKLKLVQCWNQTGNYQKSRDTLQQLYDRMINNGVNDGILVDIVQKMAYVYSMASKPEQSIQKYLQCISIIQKNNSQATQNHSNNNNNVSYLCSKLYSKISNIYLDFGNTIKCVNNAQKAKQLLHLAESTEKSCKKVNNSQKYIIDKSDCYLELAIVHKNLQLYEQAKMYFNKCIHVLQSKLEILPKSQKQANQNVNNQNQQNLCTKPPKLLQKYINALLCLLSLHRCAQKQQQFMKLLQKTSTLALFLFGTESIRYSQVKQQEGLYYMNKQCNVLAIYKLTQSINILVSLDEEYYISYLDLFRAEAYIRIVSLTKTCKSCKNAAEITQKNHGNQSIEGVIIGGMISKLMFEIELQDIAKDGCRQVVEVYEKLGMVRSGNYMTARINLVKVLCYGEEIEEAEQLLRETMDQVKQWGDNQNSYYGRLIQINSPEQSQRLLQIGERINLAGELAIRKLQQN